MDFSVFKNPLVIAALVGSAIAGGAITYSGQDCSMARAQAEREARKQAVAEQLKSNMEELKAKMKEDSHKNEKNPFLQYFTDESSPADQEQE